MIIDSRYNVLERLGVGIWATVYKVQDLRTEKIYSLKLFQNIEPDKFYEKFSPEDMHHITKILHPNLLSVLNFGIHSNSIYYLSEYYPGKTLNNFSFKPYQLETFYDIIVQICYGLNALHSQGIIHKDLKPDNILYTYDNMKPEVKILDFGFARNEVEGDRQKFSGTLPYIAPEILLGQKSTPQSDFYSLGITLYRITTGSFPFTLEQILDFISGRTHIFFPKFPKELNPDIPLQLERLILRLLEIKPQSRFSDAHSIIAYINRIQLKSYPFSTKRSVVDIIRFSSYIVREDYAHRLVGYLPQIENYNGKVITLYGGIGLGKSNILALFRYHMLRPEYFIFDYECAENAKDPFFALIKEFYAYVVDNEKFSHEFEHISSRFKKYLHGEEKESEEATASKHDLAMDFEIAGEILVQLSQIKPLIFIIHHSEHLTLATIDFINYMYKDIISQRILIIFSSNDPNQFSELIHPVEIKVQSLTLDETTTYVQKLTGTAPDEHFIEQLWERTYGIPDFVTETLIDLTEQKLIFHEDNFNLNYDFQGYELPIGLLHHIYNRMSHLTEFSYACLQKLSICFCPLSPMLIKEVLQIDDRQLFYLFQEAEKNEMLTEKNSYYYFTFYDAKKRFFRETSEQDKVAVSKVVLAYFTDQLKDYASFAEGLIKNAFYAQDYLAVRKLKLALVKYYSEQKRQERAFSEICQIIEHDFSGSIEVSGWELKQDLETLREKAELTGALSEALILVNSISNFPDIFEKYYIKGIFYLGLEEYKNAVQELENATKIAVTGKEKITSMISLAWCYMRQNKLTQAKEILDIIDGYPLDSQYKISYIDRKSVFLNMTNHPLEAIALVEEFIPTIKMEETVDFQIKLGNLFNNLAFFYSNLREFEQAEVNFKKAVDLWEKVNYQRSLPIVYINIGDLAVRQGQTEKALENFDRAHEIYAKIESKPGQALVYINYGELYIKLGEFTRAEQYLNMSAELLKQLEDKSLVSIIQDNLCLAKSKIIDFVHFYNYLQEIKPEIIREHFTEISPLVKTYFYYLFSVGQIEKIETLIKKNTFLNFGERQEEEFFHQLQGLLFLHKGEEQNAIDHFKLSLELAQRNKTSYGLAIIYIRLCETYVQQGDAKSARFFYEKAYQLSSRYNFKYWLSIAKLLKVQIDFLDAGISHRIMLRQLNLILNEAIENNYFLVQIRALVLLVQVYLHAKNKRKAELYFEKLLAKVDEAVKGIPEEDALSYKKLLGIEHRTLSAVKRMKIVERTHALTENWQEDLYGLIKLKEVERIKFFIEQLLHKILSPWYFALILENGGQTELFQYYNIEPEALMSGEIQQKTQECLEENKLIAATIENSNVLFIPLGIKRARVGVFVLADAGEMEFTEQELKILHELRLHLSSLLTRILDFANMNRQMDLMRKLMHASRKFTSVLDKEKLETEIVTFCIDFTRSTRGLLVKKDKYGNYVFSVAIDEKRENIYNEGSISKTVLSEVSVTKRPVYTNNAKEDNLFRNSISVQDFSLHSIYAAPLFIDNQIYGYLYLDDYAANDFQMDIQPDFMELLLTQIGVALKNTAQYAILMERNTELVTLDQVKESFMAIVSHELNTPLLALQGYLNKYLRERYKDETEKRQTVEKIKSNMKRLLSSTSDIQNLIRYRVMTDLPKEPLEIKETFGVIKEEALLSSPLRDVEISLDIQENLDSINVNQQAFHLMIYNIILNSIRYSKDPVKIILGIRRSAFQSEELNNKQSLVIYVQDNGDGIEEEELKNIFKSFYESKDIYTHKSGFTEYNSSGLGIGLSTVKRIVELHNGKIWMESKVNEGTTVYFALPLD